MPVSTDGTKLLARGATVTLSDGVPRQVILDMEALVVIEERLGSLSAYSEGLIRGFKGKVVKSVLAGLTAGLSHLTDTKTGLAEFPAPRVARLMRYQDLQSYIDALDVAWEMHLPTVNGQTPGKDSGTASNSRGPNSTAVPPSTTVAAPVSSGA